MSVRVRIVRTAAAAMALAALAACSSGSSGSSADSWNESRQKQGGYTKAQTATALGVLDRLAKAGVTCTDPGEEQFQALVLSYTRQHLPLPAGSASCTGPNDENLLVEVFRAKGYPTAADFMARKRALLCKKALEIGKQPTGPNNFPGIPYVIAKDRSWVLEPDSFEVNQQVAKALGLKSINACEGIKV